MNYTFDNMHPEDAISKIKNFINELQTVQTTYFENLVSKLGINKEGEDWLFDYIFNTTEEDKYDDFEHYLQDYKKTYSDFVQKHDTMYNSAETFLSTDFGEFSPMLHMSSYEADLETAFPSPYDNSEQVSSELDTITFKSDLKEIKD
jgi:hypothetical protein